MAARLHKANVQGLKYSCTYAVAQIPTHKDEDVWAVYDNAEGDDSKMCGAAFLLCDGHGGREAASMCRDRLLGNLQAIFADAKENMAAAAKSRQKSEEGGGDQDVLKAKLLDRNAWMGYMMDTTIEESFRQMDLEVKKETMSGTTASLILFRSDPLDGTELNSTEPSVLMKVAWVGDSRCTRSLLGPKGYLDCEDLSRDHRPDLDSEMARLSHSMHGRVDFSKDVIVVETESQHGKELSVRGAGGLEPLSKTIQSIDKDLKPLGGVRICYDTPGFPLEASLHGSRRGPRLTASMHGGASAPHLRRTSSGGSSTENSVGRARQPIGRLVPSASATEFRDLDNAGGTHAENSTKSKTSDPGDSMSSKFGSMRFDPVVEGIEEHKEVKGAKGLAATTSLPTVLPTIDGQSDAFFLGRLQARGMTSGKRVFNATGASTAFTRSIGDRDAGNVIISKPEVNTMEVPVQPGNRCIMASDGVWDVISTEDAHKMIKSLEPGKAAQKLASEAKSKRVYGGLAPDDITVIIVDVKDKSTSMTDGVAANAGGADSSETSGMCGCFCVGSKPAVVEHGDNKDGSARGGAGHTHPPTAA